MNIRKANLLIVDADGSRRIESLNSPVRVLGRTDKGADILLDTPIVSREHGRFFFQEDDWYYVDLDSTNGTFVNEHHVYHDGRPQRLTEGTTLRIDDVRSMGRKHKEGILLYFFYGDMEEKYETFDLEMPPGTVVEIGREQSCPIFLDTVSVSRFQGYLSREGGRLFYTNCGNGSAFLNGRRIGGKVPVTRQDVLVLGNIKLLFVGSAVIYSRPHTGSYLKIRGLTRVVKDYNKRGQKKTILNDVNVDVPEGKLVAILGGSGAGKTTFMNCVIGYEPPTNGVVLLNGANLLEDKKSIRRIIGYVPQEDLLREGLSIEHTLDYVGRLRLPKDVSKQERQEKIRTIMDDLDLDQKLRKTHVRKLSGGQRKRVSIATELISDPPLLFLDEPTSGLDPETETRLVMLMKKLAHERGKTLMVVTHTIRNIREFDQVLFFGPGGRLCFSGSPEKALHTFGVDDVANIYSMVTERPEYYAAAERKKAGVDDEW